MIKWSVPKIWEGGEAWIIGGGMSMPYQFGVPEDIIQRVSKGQLSLSEYSPYLQPLKDKHVIGVNVAYKFNGILSAHYFGDRTFFKRNKKNLLNYNVLKITHSNLSRHDTDYHRDIKKLRSDTKTLGLSTDPGLVYWNFNSGSAAINVAVLAGAKRILLLGFDMKPFNGEERVTHWHSDYGKFRIQDRDFKRFLKGFPQIAEDAKKLGVEILNVNKDSAIDSFKKIELKEVL